MFTYKDYEKITPGSKEYNDICALLFKQYGDNLKATTLETSDDFITKVNKLTDYVNSKNIMKTRDLEEMITAIKENRCNDKSINPDDKDAVYCYMAAQVAKIAGNDGMYQYFIKKGKK
ncbi:hypothetical protein IKS57_05235 [bacterium]|nr:hypothetical protein [bacterium]